MIGDNKNFKLNDSLNEEIVFENDYAIKLYLKREDQIHPIISGNKYRKLKYNLEQAKKEKKDILLTFGGAYSNHIAATAEAGNVFGFKTIGIIRGEELLNKIEENETLRYAQSCGMQFEFITRSDYREKTDSVFLNHLKLKFGDFYMIPEGGTNHLAVRGCEEILTKADEDFDYVCVSVGTGGTLAGIVNCSKPSQQVLGFSALKGDFLKEDISKFVTKNNWQLVSEYHFGGYGKISKALIEFINGFKRTQNIQLDPIYTGKMMYGVFDRINKGFFSKHSKIVVIHTGGIQGIKGVNHNLKKRGLTLIN